MAGTILRVATASLLCMLSACEARSAISEGAEVADSAGVRVVINRASDLARAPWLRLSAEPLLEIGVVDGAPEYQLFRANTAATLSDGTLVVANSGTQHLRYYDAEGIHLRTAGGEGEGPGEFMALSVRGTLPGDSVIAWDTRLRRISIFTASGEFARSFSPPVELGPVLTMSDALSDGRVLVQVPSTGRPPLDVTQTTVLRHTDPLLLLAPDGTTSEIGTFPSSEVVVHIGNQGPAVLPVMFGRSLSYHATGDRIAIGTNDVFSVRVYDGAGSLLHVVRLERAPTPVAEGDFERALPPPTGIGVRILEAAPHMPRHPTFPEYDQLRVGRDGHLWVRDYMAPSMVGPSQWHRFDANGQLVARITLPAGMNMIEAESDRILVRAVDDLGVETIAVHRLE